VACTLLLINRTDTYRFGWLLICLEFRSEQVYNVHSKRVSFGLDSNRERDLSKGWVHFLSTSTNIFYLKLRGLESRGCYWLDDRGIHRRQDTAVFSSVQTDAGVLTPLSNGCWRLFPRSWMLMGEVDRIPRSRAEVRNELGYTFTLPIRFHGELLK
jgi:hypothetical protein